MNLEKCKRIAIRTAKLNNVAAVKISYTDKKKYYIGDDNFTVLTCNKKGELMNYNSQYAFEFFKKRAIRK